MCRTCVLHWPFEVISAIGSIGSADDEQGNGATNEAAVAAAAKAGVKRFVLVSASKDKPMCLMQEASTTESIVLCTTDTS